MSDNEQCLLSEYDQLCPKLNSIEGVIVKKNNRILIVDDDEDILTAGALLLKRHFREVVTCNSPDKIPLLVATSPFDAILLDMNFSPGESDGAQGFIWLERILDIDPDAVIIMITAHGGVKVAVEAMKQGATDFISKPWENEKVVATLSSAVQLHESRAMATQLKQSNRALSQASGHGHQQILGNSQAMETVHSIIRRTAPTDANVLILGENGTGKELVARELHTQSLREGNVFMSVDLGAVSENLFESELFGHQKGAFTGADQDRIGKLVATNGGTLFLDEIGNIPLHLQAKLLTVLEQRQVTPLGSNTSIPLNIRVIAATNISREVLSDENRFRQDLLFRLNTVELCLPNLHQRSEDIPEIAQYYVSLYTQKYRKPEKQFSAEALRAAQAYHWPGNVRALRHAIERAVILSEGPYYEAIDLQLDSPIEYATEDVSNTDQETPESSVISGSLDLNIERTEKRLVEKALQIHRFNISKAAKELGLTRAALYRRMEKYGF